MTTLDGPVMEKKVPLPDRWLRGFAEAVVTAAGFDLRAHLPAAEAVCFLRGPEHGAPFAVRGGWCRRGADGGPPLGRCRARGELPHLAQTAGRRGSSRPVAQARRLRSALVERVATRRRPAGLTSAATHS